MTNVSAIETDFCLIQLTLFAIMENHSGKYYLACKSKIKDGEWEEVRNIP